MNKLFYPLLLLIISFTSLQCKKNDGEGMINPDTGTDYTKPNPITASVHGNIVDENGNPAPGVVVKVGTQNATTDADGHFFIGDAALDKNTSMLVAEKAGYFKSIKSFAATAGVNYLRIKLIKKVMVSTVESATGGVATLTDGSKITIEPNSIVDKISGAAYTGSINIYAVPIDPTASDIAETVPGSFMGNDSSGNRVVLQSFGMMAIELESATGASLQIKTGSNAELNFTIPALLQSKAPATLPLWFIDETTGLWQQEGTAVKSGNSYIGIVKHFSFWNGDDPEGVVKFTARLMYTNIFFGPNGPITNIKVQISDGKTALYEYTDNNGFVSGYIPKDKQLTLSVINACGIVIYSTQIGPYSKDVDYGEITLDAGNYKLTTITGKLLNCNGGIVTEGAAILHTGYLTYYAPVNEKGQYFLYYTRCSDILTLVDIIGVDSVTKQQSETFPLTVVPDADIIFMPDIKACGISTEEYINYTVDSVSYNYDESNSSEFYSYIFNNIIYLSGGFGEPELDYEGINFSFRNTSDTGEITINDDWYATNGNFSLIPVPLQPPLKGLLTEYPSSIGQFYVGSFSGEVQESGFTATPKKHRFSCTFRVKRQR